MSHEKMNVRTFGDLVDLMDRIAYHSGQLLNEEVTEDNVVSYLAELRLVSYHLMMVVTILRQAMEAKPFWNEVAFDFDEEDMMKA